MNNENRRYTPPFHERLKELDKVAKEMGSKSKEGIDITEFYTDKLLLDLSHATDQKERHRLVWCALYGHHQEKVSTAVVKEQMKSIELQDTLTPKRKAHIITEVFADCLGLRESGRVNQQSLEAVYNKYFPLNAETDFQSGVDVWMMECFGIEISRNQVERNHRFLEEALELVQSLGCTQSEANQLVEYVFGRPIGEPYQEVGGVMVTLAALCLAADLKMDECGNTELKRIWTKIPAIRAKQAAKPPHSPLPETK